MFYQLPPVGNPIQLSPAEHPQPDALAQAFTENYRARYYASGTAALAAAIIAAIRLKAVDRPEVIIPAYGCPDLISAALFAGALPVLVDLEADRPWMSLEQIPDKINANTVAIIAVNLFGISERLELLRPLAEQAGALLIEDSAQAFPGDTEQGFWQGDLVVLSFGRGKPVSLLGGGAVLCHKKSTICSKLVRQLPEVKSSTGARLPQQAAFRLKARLYNSMIRPRVYWLPRSLPFLHLGETHYHPIQALEGMDPIQLSMLPANINAYQADPASAQNMLSTALAQCEIEDRGIIDLAVACNNPRHRRLLRYPLLVEPALRDQLYTGLQKSGLGSSRLYPKALPEIAGLETLLSAQGEFPAAASFAERILTLPTHAQVKPADIDKTRLILSC
jgi:dTDP-4-amino-4,6-dideoxygalactose transaminase